MNKTSLYILKTRAIIQHRFAFALTLALCFIVLFVIYCPSFRWGFPKTVWTILDPVAGILTLLTAVYIYWMQAKKQWEDSLEKRLDIDYEFDGKKVVQIKGAYLASESDVRNWAQSLGNQIMGQLDFEMNWLEERPEIIVDTIQKRFIKKYKVTMYLTSDPIEKSLDRINDFLSRKLKHSEINGDNTHLPIIWSRINKIVK